MPRSHVLEVTLSEESLEFVRDTLASGAYRSESEILEDSLRAWKEEVEQQRRFEQEVVIPAHDELMANLSSAIPLEQVERNLAAARSARLKAR